MVIIMLAMKLDNNYNILKNLSKEEFNNILESKDCQEIFNDYTPEELSVLITLFYKNGDYINKLLIVILCVTLFQMVLLGVMLVLMNL